MGKSRILVVDDDPMNREIIDLILGETFILKEAETGENALEALKEFHPDLILLDIMLPGIDGYEVCRRIRKDPKYQFIKIILISGKAMVEERLEGYNAGADDYITKPFVDEELDAKTKVYLRLKRVEEVDQIKTDLLTLMSHEYRTPLNAIIGCSDIIGMADNMTEENKKLALSINHAGLYILNIAEKSTLLFSLMNQKQIEKKFCFVNELIESFLDSYCPGNDKQINIQTSFKNKIQININLKLVEIILGYLLDNAIKYSPQGSTVHIDCSETESESVISFIDQGKGISKDWIDQIFNLFAIQEIEHHQKGQGLSLAIARYVMQLHGGKITVQSSEGEGAVFGLIFSKIK